MGIEEYLSKYGMTKRGFARRLGVTESNLHKILSGKSYPTAKTAQKIVKLTNGEVTFEDLFKEKENGEN